MRQKLPGVPPEVSQGAALLGRTGGNRTKERFGSEHYQEIGRKGAQVLRERRAQEKGETSDAKTATG